MSSGSTRITVADLNTPVAFVPIPFRGGRADLRAQAKAVRYLIENNFLDSGVRRAVANGGSSLVHHLSAEELLEAVDLARWRQHTAAELPYGRKRALELATTLALEPSLVLLDEPMAGLGHEDIGPVTRLIANVARRCTVLMVEHNMKVVASIADRITVLARGAVLAEGDYATVSKHPAVLEAYMGTEATELVGAH